MNLDDEESLDTVLNIRRSFLLHEACPGHYVILRGVYPERSWILRLAQNDKRQRARNDTLYWIASATPRNDRERKLAITRNVITQRYKRIKCHPSI